MVLEKTLEGSTAYLLGHCLDLVDVVVSVTGAELKDSELVSLWHLPRQTRILRSAPLE